MESYMFDEWIPRIEQFACTPLGYNDLSVEHLNSSMYKTQLSARNKPDGSLVLI